MSSTDQQKLAGVYKFPQEIIERINYPPSTFTGSFCVEHASFILPVDV